MTDFTVYNEQYKEKVRAEFKSAKKKRGEVAVVAGAAGFVGSRICEALVNVGLKVIGIDSFISGKEKYLENLISCENFELLEADLQQGIPEVLLSKNITYIVDALDVYPHVGRTEFGLNELLNNSITLKNLLSFANQTNARVIFTSSVDIYQGLASHEYLQNYYDGRELTSYYEFLEGKRYGEALCREYVDKFGLDVRVARLAEVYGPRMDIQSSSVLARAIRLALDGKDLIFDEEGSQQHQLIYIDDFVYGLLKLLFAEDEKLRGGIFYFVNPEPVSTLSIAYTLRELTGKDLKVEFIPKHRKVGMPVPQKIDITRTMKLLKWNPKIPLTEGLEYTLHWFVDVIKKKETEVLQHKEVPQAAPPTVVAPGEEARPTEEENYVAQPQPEEPYVPQPQVDKEQQVTTPAVKSTDHPVENERRIVNIPKMPGKSDTTKESGTSVKDIPVMEPVAARENDIKKPANSNTAKGWLSLTNKKKTGKPLKEIKSFASRLSLNFSLKDILRYWPEMLLGILLFVVLVSIPLLISMGLAWRAQTAFVKHDYAEAERLLYQSASLYKYYKKPASWVGLSKEFDAVESVYFIGIDSARFAQDIRTAMEDLSPMSDTLQTSLLDGQTDEGYSVEELYSMVDKAVINYRSARTWFVIMSKRLNSVDERYLPSALKDKIGTIKELSWLTSPILENGDKLLYKLDKILGFDRPKRYIIWLQNSNEIRPTGGFIGSYVAITLHNGRVTDFKVDDIYNPDGLLGEHEDPPIDPIMQSFFKTNTLWIRDTNWWTDFPTSAATFVQLYERATKEKIDGVITFNLAIAEKLLSKIGPVEVKEYGETITSENLFMSAETHAEIGFKPGSTNKRDFLGALFESVMAKLVAGDKRVLNGVVETFAEGIVSRDVMFYFTDEEIEKISKSMQVAGSMLEADSSDYIRVVDSNIGVNKVNEWIKRSSSYEVDVDRDGYLMSTLEVSWENTAQNNTWPRGEYVNYVRIYVPKDVSMVKVDPELPEQTVKTEFGKTMIAGIVRVPIKSTKKIKVTYLLPRTIQLGKGDDYRLIWETQPGIVSENISFSLNLPVFLMSDKETSFNRVLDWPINVIIPVTKG